MKSFLCSLFLILSVIFAVPVSAQKPLKIVTTFYPIYIMTINVVGQTPGVEVTNLTPPVTGCLHDYALTASDMKKLADADILVANGAGMESFLEQAIRQFPAVRIVQASQGIELLQSAQGVNPHVFVGVSGAIEEVRNIAAGLEKEDAAHQQDYRANAQTYISKLVSLEEKMRATLAPYRGEKIVTFHEAFPYFAKEFGFEIAAVVERESGSAPSAQELAGTIELVKRNGIKFIFSEPQYPADTAQVIARETGAKVLVLDPAVTGPMQPGAYIQIMEKNLKTLEEAFR